MTHAHACEHAEGGAWDFARILRASMRTALDALDEHGSDAKHVPRNRCEHFDDYFPRPRTAESCVIVGQCTS